MKAKFYTMLCVEWIMCKMQFLCTLLLQHDIEINEKITKKCIRFHFFCENTIFPIVTTSFNSWEIPSFQKLILFCKFENFQRIVVPNYEDHFRKMAFLSTKWRKFWKVYFILQTHQRLLIKFKWSPQCFLLMAFLTAFITRQDHKNHKWPFLRKRPWFHLPKYYEPLHGVWWWS